MSEVGNISIDEARELVSDPALWPLVRDLLWNFAPQIHPSWLDSLGRQDGPDGQGGLDGLGWPGAPGFRERMSSPRVRRFVLDSLGVEPCFHSFPKDDGSRLLLLDGATLLEIAKWLGALAGADALRLVTSGKVVRGLKAALPGVYPEVFAYTAYFRKLKAEGPKAGGSWADDPEAILRVGASMLVSFLAGLSAPLRHRLLLKLPKNLQPSDSPSSTLQPSTLQLLLKLRFPEAHSLCC